MAWARFHRATPTRRPSCRNSCEVTRTHIIEKAPPGFLASADFQLSYYLAHYLQLKGIMKAQTQQDIKDLEAAILLERDQSKVRALYALLAKLYSRALAESQEHT